MSIADRMNLFFQDYSMVPLFVQENYSHVWPHKATLQHGKAQKIEAVRLLAKAADALSYGDVVERKIRSSNDWSLLTGQSLLSCAIPSYLMSGTGRVNNFPSWFGKTSHNNKIVRVVQQLALHTSIATGIAGKTNFALDYIPALKSAVIEPLLKEADQGVPKTIEVFEQYDLLRDDLDALLEVDQWPGAPDLWKQVESKVKAQLTRQYNKSGHMTHYAVVSMSGGRKKAAAADDMEGLLGEESNDGPDSEGEEEDGDDPMVKAASKAKGAKAATGSARGGRGGGRGGSRGGRGGRGGSKK